MEKIPIGSLHRHRLCGGWGGGAPLGLALKGRNVSGPLIFFCKYYLLATRKSKLQTEIEPECGKDLFFVFGLRLNLGAKFRNVIELLSLTKLCKNILPPRNLLNKKSTPMVVC